MGKIILKGNSGLYVRTDGSSTLTQIIDTAGNVTAAANSISSSELALNTIQTAEVTITATEIVGTAAGDIGHASGATLLASAGAGTVIEFISAVLIYDFDTAAYTGGGNDLVIKQGSTTLTAAIASADLLGASADKIVQSTQLSASDQALTADTGLSLVGTAYTQPGTAAGVLRVKLAYRVHNTGL